MLMFILILHFRPPEGRAPQFENHCFKPPCGDDSAPQKHNLVTLMDFKVVDVMMTVSK